MILWTAKIISMEVENTENIFVYIIVDANLLILCQDISASKITLGPNQTYLPHSKSYIYIFGKIT